ncbi:RNA polymerase factor sigma-70 [Duganella radicis]|uniref:RNA polymerase factor sigma-70 n=1 Tax=Duganella radicis TaxID=551988 RepID=A0A6L6PDG6_9BURK|nr:RNA polymerase factor sigma-70 [Duganella radicis]MTV36739.1 RNA polymerase factor sigma-70 [Duganella radicis]
MESIKPHIDWSAMFVANQPQLLRAAFKVLGNTAWAQDVVQDSYLKVTEAGHAVEARQPLAYLFQIVRNLAIDAHRRAALEARVFADEEDGLQVPAPSGTPESLSVSRQDLRIVADALAALPERTRSAFELHRLGGLTQREIAEQLGVSITLVNFMIRDAMTHCANALAPSHA